MTPFTPVDSLGGGNGFEARSGRVYHLTEHDGVGGGLEEGVQRSLADGSLGAFWTPPQSPALVLAVVGAYLLEIDAEGLGRVLVGDRKRARAQREPQAVLTQHWTHFVAGQFAPCWLFPGVVVAWRLNRQPTGHQIEAHGPAGLPAKPRPAQVCADALAVHRGNWVRMGRVVVVTVMVPRDHAYHEEGQQTEHPAKENKTLPTRIECIYSCRQGRFYFPLKLGKVLKIPLIYRLVS